LVASFMNPHDICDWIRQHKGTREFPADAVLPPAPLNMAVDPNEPEAIQYHRTAGYDLMSQAVGIASEWRRDDVRLYLHDYYRMVEQVDGEIGKVLKALRETGQESNTVIVFASDHGEGLGGHRWAQKASFYEALRVPFFVAGSGIAAGVNGELTTLADIVPTMCALAGIPAPADVRGVNVCSGFTRQFVASELRYDIAEREGRILRTKTHKYVRFNSGAPVEQLFDLEVDPGETFNLAGRGGTILEAHRGLMNKWLSQTGDRFVRI
jgi:arylsulfatase A-like enzyme